MTIVNDHRSSEPWSANPFVHRFYHPGMALTVERVWDTQEEALESQEQATRKFGRMPGWQGPGTVEERVS